MREEGGREVGREVGREGEKGGEWTNRRIFFSFQVHIDLIVT